MTPPTIPVFVGRVDESGKLTPDSPHAMVSYIRTLAGETVEITVRKKGVQRSNRANRYYFGVVVKMIAEYCGYEPDEMHEVLAMRFLRIEDCPITGAPRRKHTPATNTAEFSNYVEQCIRFAAELGVVIPSSDQVEAVN